MSTELDTWPRRRSRRYRRLSQQDGGNGAAPSSAELTYDFEFRPSRQGSKEIAPKSIMPQRRRTNSYERVSEPTVSRGRSLSTRSSRWHLTPDPGGDSDWPGGSGAVNVVSINPEKRYSNGLFTEDDAIALGPFATSAGRSVAKILSTFGPQTVCNVFWASYLVVASVSLLTTLLYSSTKESPGGGFAVGTYMVVLGIMFIMPAQNRHYQHCKCTPEARARLERIDDMMSTSQYTRGLRVIRERLEGLNQDMQALRLQNNSSVALPEPNVHDWEHERKPASILRMDSNLAMSDSEDERQQHGKATAAIKASSLSADEETSTEKGEAGHGSDALVKRTDSDLKDGFDDIEEEDGNESSRD